MLRTPTHSQIGTLVEHRQADSVQHEIGVVGREALEDRGYIWRKAGLGPLRTTLQPPTFDASNRLNLVCGLVPWLPCTDCDVTCLSASTDIPLTVDSARAVNRHAGPGAQADTALQSRESSAEAACYFVLPF
jgi:hypothetical protein